MCASPGSCPLPGRSPNDSPSVTDGASLEGMISWMVRSSAWRASVLVLAVAWDALFVCGLPTVATLGSRAPAFTATELRNHPLAVEAARPRTVGGIPQTGTARYASIFHPAIVPAGLVIRVGPLGAILNAPSDADVPSGTIFPFSVRGPPHDLRHQS